MARYASGKKSVAISDISGFKVKYNDLKTTWDGLRVEPQDWEPKHPQLTPAKNVIDATALFQPRVDNDPENVSFFVGFNTDIFASKIENSQKGVGIKGTGFIQALDTNNFKLSGDVTGVEGTSAIGTVLIDISIDETSCIGTGAIGTVIPTGKKTVTGVAGDGDTGTLNFKSSITEVGVAGTGAIGTESVNIGGWGQEGFGISTWGDG